jgi:ribosomal protein S1
LEINRNFLRPVGTEVKVTSSALDKLYRAYNSAAIKEVPIIQVQLHGSAQAWKIDIEGIYGYVPFDKSGLKYENQLKQFVGQKIYVKIESIHQEDEPFAICDRKSAVEVLSKEVLDKIALSQELQAVIKGLGDNMVYLDVGGGLVAEMPRQEATLSKARRSLRSEFHVGQLLTVKIIKLDKMTFSVTVSRTALLTDPWKNNQYSAGDVVPVEIVNIVGQQIYAEVIPGIVGMIATPNAPVELAIGDKVQCSVIRFDPGQKKMRMRYRQKIK